MPVWQKQAKCLSAFGNHGSFSNSGALVEEEYGQILVMKCPCSEDANEMDISWAFHRLKMGEKILKVLK